MIIYGRGLHKGMEHMDIRVWGSLGLSWRLATIGSNKCYGGYKKIKG